MQSLFFNGINHSLTEDWEHVLFLKSLDLSQSDFDGAASVAMFCDGLRENVGLVKLRLENCRLEDDELADIVHALISHPTLKDLSLALNYAGSDTIDAVSKLLLTQTQSSSKFGQLERLDLGQQTPGHLRNMNLVYDALQHNNTLKSLCLRENYLLRSQIPQLIDALKVNNVLEELNLEDCDIRKEGLEAVVNNISHYNALRILRLRKNVTSIRDNVNLASSLPHILEANHVMQVLDLDEQWIPDLEQRRKVEKFLHLNKAGRRFLKSTSSDGLPLGMWPLLLERVDRQLFSQREEFGQEREDETSDSRSDSTSTESLAKGGMCASSTLFFLLHGPALCQR
eukprot:CAMPEP_0178762082 /NCGR_PEP_ID=MMETSP0744-20121128/16350_1 /TAXON_ID=913974 /ORGANISM="Nitzschia punctata, Strain CCMP561" /LENGTH=340 /DNA_ID=CAMNT_0020416731 /DNA_START=1 /DNA_END=1023 /DNA_ORIENTATION=-